MENIILILFALLPLLVAGMIFISRKFLCRKKCVISLIAGNILCFLFLISLLLLGFEIYFRFIFDSTESMISTKTSQKWFKNHYFANKSGFRDNIEYFKNIPTGKRRITFLGDSFTVGQGVEVEQRFVNLVRSQNKDWNIHALAIPGWSTREEIDILRCALKSGYELDIVVLVYFFNDISYLNIDKNRKLAPIFENMKSKNFFISNSYFLDHLHFRIQYLLTPEVQNYSHDVVESYQGEIWEKHVEDLKGLKQIIESNNACLKVVIFPFMQNVADDYGFQKIHDILKIFLHSEQIPYLDLLDIYKEKQDAMLVVNPYDAHPSSYAHKIAAEAIYKFLSGNMQKRDTGGEHLLLQKNIE